MTLFLSIKLLDNHYKYICFIRTDYLYRYFFAKELIFVIAHCSINDTKWRFLALYVDRGLF